MEHPAPVSSMELALQVLDFVRRQHGPRYIFLQVPLAAAALNAVGYPARHLEMPVVEAPSLRHYIPALEIEGGVVSREGAIGWDAIVDSALQGLSPHVKRDTPQEISVEERFDDRERRFLDEHLAPVVAFAQQCLLGMTTVSASTSPRQRL